MLRPSVRPSVPSQLSVGYPLCDAQKEEKSRKQELEKLRRGKKERRGARLQRQRNVGTDEKKKEEEEMMMKEKVAC